MRLLPLAIALALAGCAAPDVAPTPAPPDADAPAAPTAAPAPTRLELAFEGFSRPLLLTHDPEGALYVVEQDGRIWRLVDGTRETWLDLDERVESGGNEQGLLGLAFHPDGSAYVSYTENGGDSVLARVEEDRALTPVLRVEQPYSNHNGGHIAVGPDGWLWYGLGDGGGAHDPQGNAQDPEALLGSLLRIDVANGSHEPDIWAKGLRNPWRFSFDAATGDLYIADVGQGSWEEIDFVAAGAAEGLNFGWPAYEANERHPLRSASSEVTPPVHAYPLRVEGRCAIIGGHVYRGDAHPGLAGEYVFGDHCSGEIWGLRFVDGAWRVRDVLDTDLQITSFGEGPDGELYVVAREGAIYRLVAGP